MVLKANTVYVQYKMSKEKQIIISMSNEARGTPLY